MFYKFIFVLSVSTFAGCYSDFQSATREKDFQDLSGSWEIYTGSPFTNESDTVSIPSNLKNFVNYPTDSIVLRKRFELKTSVDLPLSLILGKISDHAEVRWNGQELSEELFGDYLNSTPQGYDRTRIYSISEKTILQKNEILVFVRPYFDYEYGILSGPIGIGPSAVIWKKFYLREIGGLLMSGSFLLVGGFFLFLSLREKKGEENFYFGLFLVSFALFQVSLSELKYLTGWKILYLKKIEYSLLAFLFPLFCRFLNSLFKKAHTRLHTFLEIATLAIFVWILFAQTVSLLDAINRYVLQVSWIGFVYFSLKILVPNLKKSFESRTILSGILFLLICVGIDVFSQRGMFKIVRLSGLGVSGFLFF